MDNILGFAATNAAALMLSFCALVVVVFLAREHLKGRLDLATVLEDSDKPHVVSLPRTGMFVSLCVSTWAFVYLTLHDRLTETYIGLYMAAWAGAGMFNKWMVLKNMQQPTTTAPPQTDDTPPQDAMK